MSESKTAVVKIVDNFQSPFFGEFPGLNRLEGNDVVVVEQLKDGEKSTEGVLVSDFVSDDSFSDLGTPSQRLELLKTRFRGTREASAVDYLKGNAHSDQDCAMYGDDTVILEKREKPFSDQGDTTSLPISVNAFLNSPSFDHFGTREDRLRYLQASFFSYCGDGFSYRPVGSAFFGANNANSDEVAVDFSLKSKVELLETERAIRNMPPPAKGFLYVQEYQMKIPPKQGYFDRDDTVTVRSLGVYFTDASGGRKKFSLRIQKFNGDYVAYLSTGPDKQQYDKDHFIDILQLQEFGLNLKKVAQGHGGKIALSPQATAYFWKLAQERK